MGFAFNPNHDRVVLVRKDRPRWMAGKLNGVGGKVEYSDPRIEMAMSREFKEETGVEIHCDRWNYFGNEEGNDFLLHLFAIELGESEFSACKTTETEEILKINLPPMWPQPAVEGMWWKVHAAQASLENRNLFIEAKRVEII